MEFGEKLKLIRERRGYYQKDIADFLKVKQQTVSAWEKGNGQPDIETLNLLASFLNIDLNYLISTSTDLRFLQATDKDSRAYEDYESLPPEAKKEADDHLKYLKSKYGVDKKNNAE